MTTQITGNNITSGSITVTQLVSGISGPKIQSIAICDSSFNVLDDTAANTTGGFIQINGSSFGANSQIVIGTNNATSVTFVNTSTLRAQVGAAAAATYPVYVIDTDTGATAIRVNGFTTSSFTAWSTGSSLDTKTAGTFFAVNLSATSDSNITYSNTTSLPAGTTLAANGYFSGTVSIGSTTTFNFTVRANDAENQDASRTFSMTISVVPQTRLYAWGRGYQGQLGLNATNYVSSPTQVGTETTWRQIDGGLTNAAATKTDGTLWTWGHGNRGFLGNNNGSNQYRSSPVQVGTDITWSVVSVSDGKHAAALKTDLTLWTWGRGYAGGLGHNDEIYRSSPTQVGTNTTWSKISVFSASTLAIKTDLTLWTWGSGYNGGTGHNTTNATLSPRQLGSGTNWSLAKGGYYCAAAVKTDGTLWMWGNNSDGQLGQNNTYKTSSPVQVGTGTNWSQVNLSVERHVLITKTDGTLWAWGKNDNGQLGLGNTINRSSPVQVGVATNWSMVSAGQRGSGAIKTDGTLWVWGIGTYGVLGQNNTSGSQVPVQVGTGTNWSFVEMTNEFGSFAITSV
jgi:alpha-tubulin suppressor-like RCC1 family protein